MKRIAIIGFGRFGELLASYATKQGYGVTVIANSPERVEQARRLGYETGSMELISGAHIIFPAVPISAFEQVIQEVSPRVTKDSIVADVCSVKMFPAKTMQAYLHNCQAIATHPLFGPDSAARGLQDLRVAFCPLEASAEAVKIVREFWEKAGARVIETTPEQHDHDVAYSQAMPYILAHALNRIDLPELTFPTVSSKALYDIAHYSAKDTEQLFRDMLSYNPFVKEMLTKFEPSVKDTLRLAADLAGVEFKD